MRDSVLYMPVSAEWFKLIKDGIKRVEYREIKAYWIKRLFWSKTDEGVTYVPEKLAEYLAMESNLALLSLKRYIAKGMLLPAYNLIEFTEGYPKKDDTERRARYKLVNIAVGFPQKGLCPDEFLKNEYLCIEFEEL